MPYDRLTGSIEDNTLTLLCWSEQHAATIAQRVPPDLYSTRAYQRIAGLAENYLTRYHRPPGAHFARAEALCGLAWLLDDGLWLMGWRWPCYAACLLAFAAMVGVLVYAPRRQFVVACADAFWLAFNVTWSVGDMESVAWLFLGALVCFAVTILRGDVPILGRLRFWSAK